MKVVGQHECGNRCAVLLLDEESNRYWHFWGAPNDSVMVVRTSTKKSVITCHCCHEQYWWVNYDNRDVIACGAVNISYESILANPEFAVIRAALR